jgi:hypothetical protein
MLGKYRTDLLLLLHNLPLLINYKLHIGINALQFLHGDAPSILLLTSLLSTYEYDLSLLSVASRLSSREAKEMCFQFRLRDFAFVTRYQILDSLRGWLQFQHFVFVSTKLLN